MGCPINQFREYSAHEYLGPKNRHESHVFEQNGSHYWANVLYMNLTFVAYEYIYANICAKTNYC